MKDRYIWPWILTVSLIIGLIFPGLLSEGMFKDGVQYASVAKNLSNDLGTFWFPFLSETWSKAGSPYFLEQPPLVFGIQSLFFDLLGDSIYTERIYGIVIVMITSFVIVQIWNIAVPAVPKFRHMGWIPLLLWIVTPLVFWSYQNNMLENTMTLFILTAVYWGLKAIRESRDQLIYTMLMSATIVLALLSKGIPGSFPITIFGLYTVIDSSLSMRRSLYLTAVSILIVVMLFTAILFIPNAYESLSFYLESRVVERIENVPIVTNRLYIIQKLFLELMPAFVFVVVIFTIKRVREIKRMAPPILSPSFFIVMGIAGSLPMTLTFVQRPFYLVPAIPFFAIGLGLMVVEPICQLLDRLDVRDIGPLRLISILVLVGSILYSTCSMGSIGRDHHVLDDIKSIGSYVPKGSTITIDQALSEQWDVQFYLLRYFDISADISDNKHMYMLSEHHDQGQSISGIELVNSKMRNYILYRRCGL